MTSPARLLFPFMRKESRAFGLATFATVLMTLAELARPLPLALVIDQLLKKTRASGGFEVTTSDAWLLALLAGLVIAISAAQAAAAYLADISLKRAGERIVHDLRVATHVHLQRLSLRFHAQRPTGDLVTRVTGDVNAVGSLFADSLAAIASAVLLLLGMVVVSLIIDPVLALAAFAISPILGFATIRARRRLKAASRLARRTEGEIASLTAESFAAMREVKAFGSEDYEHGRLRAKSEERREAGVAAALIETRFATAIDVIGSVGIAAVLVIGVLRVASGAVTPGELVVMVAYTKKMHRPLRDIARQAGRVSRAMARAERITEILAADDLLEEKPGAYRGPRANGELELDSVSFSYEPKRPALEDVSLRVSAGEKVALVGRSGAGKSTVAGLTARFYDPNAGRILVDGRDLRDCSLRWLRGQVGLVLQDTVLFSGTVAENIAYGLRAQPDEIEAAAKAAGAHAFICELPEGYETALGPRGIGLSGGQRQRIAIARTLLRDPAILILDEPTTGLDAESEARVVEGLDRLMRGRTTIVISHSPRLLQSADRAVFIDEGRIVTHGHPAAAAVAQSMAPEVAEKLRPRVPVPADGALPQLPVLLDGVAMAPFLQRSLGPDAPLPDVRVHYLRYKPGTNIVVRYDVGIGDAWHDAVAMIAARAYLGRRAAKPENRALADAVDGRSPAPMPLHYEPQLDALIQWFPLDIELPALAVPPHVLRHELAAAGAHLGMFGEPTVLAYKPRRRAVLRVGDHVLKIYAKRAEFEAAATGLRVSGGLRSLGAPSFVAALDDRQLTVQPFLLGSRPASPLDAAAAAGELLSALHNSKENLLPPAPPAAQFAAARASAQLVVAIAPQLRRRVAALVGELADSMPEIDELHPSHGDFNARQLLVSSDGLAAVDFDAMCRAPAALDVGTYASYVVLGGRDDPAFALDVLDEVVEGYGDRPAGLSWYLATCILRRAPRPFRYLDESWPERVEGMIEAADEVLRS